MMTNLLPMLLIAYGAVLLLLSRRRSSDPPGSFLLAGRALSLPALVATMVTTWYGGILGVGEYAWRYGISTWVVFGLPYYIAAIVFGLWLAPRLRRSNAVSIPDLLGRTYGRRVALTGAAGVWAGTIPVAYLLMLATLIHHATGCPLPLATLIGAGFSCWYVGVSGFRAVVRTDVFQMALMFGGFLLLLPATLEQTGGLAGLWASLPETHRAWDGGLGWQAVLVWYLIAFQTVVEPTFYQRVFAARNPQVAKAGIVFSVFLWAIFDFLSIVTGLGARVLLPELADPLAAYPALAQLVLGPVGSAFFMLALFAIVMSTLDSYLFLAASTFGHDFAADSSTERDRRRIRIGMGVSAGLAVIGALVFDSAIDVWHHVGSVLTASLLVPVLGVHLPPTVRPSARGALAAMLLAAGTATAWIFSAGEQGYPLGMEPLFPALGVAVACWALDRAVNQPTAKTPHGEKQTG